MNQIPKVSSLILSHGASKNIERCEIHIIKMREIKNSASIWNMVLATIKGEFYTCRLVWKF